MPHCKAFAGKYFVNCLIDSNPKMLMRAENVAVISALDCSFQLFVWKCVHLIKILFLLGKLLVLLIDQFLSEQNFSIPCSKHALCSKTVPKFYIRCISFLMQVIYTCFCIMLNAVGRGAGEDCCWAMEN